MVVRRLADKGVGGFSIGGSTSELFAFTLGKRKRIIEVVRDASDWRRLTSYYHENS